MPAEPLSVIRMTEYEGWAVDCWYARGHHDLAAFAAAVEAERAADPCDETPEPPTHAWWRFTPNLVDEGVGCYVNARKARGAFAVTVSEANRVAY